MKQLLTTLVVLFLLTDKVLAQQTTQAFGKIDTADLRLADCDFEKGANALILFDKADVTAGADSVVVWRHIRIKLFNDNAKDMASVRLSYYSYHQFEEISNIEAQTVRLDGKSIIVTKLDPKAIYSEQVDKNRKAFVFLLSDAKAGSIIEYRYKLKTRSPADIPTWFFQTKAPTRYSEIDVTMSPDVKYNIIRRGLQAFVKDTTEVIVNKRHGDSRKSFWAKANINSFVEEDFVTPGNANYQSLIFQLHSVDYGYAGYHQARDDSWIKVAMRIMEDEDFGQQLDLSLSKEDVLIKQAATLQTDDEKIHYLFNEVKKAMKWNNIDSWYTNDGVRKAWNKKTGNSTEINLILYTLLKKAGINVYPMVVSTRDNGAINPEYASFSLIDKTVAYVPVDSAKYYVLDATSKYNVYDDVPIDLLSTWGVIVGHLNLNLPNFNMVFLKNNKPALKNITISAEIKADSKVSGIVSMASYSYQRAASQQLYEKLGGDKYTEYLQGKDNHLKITDIKFENLAEDSLALVQNFNFSLQLNTADEQYIYFSPNLFTPIKINPFLSEKRVSDIDFGNCNYYVIAASYKLPTGYKIDVLPKNTVMIMPDKSITFRRVVVINDSNGIDVNFRITNTRSMFGVEEYPSLRDFYQKMYEMMNEPIVLKKGT